MSTKHLEPSNKLGDPLNPTEDTFRFQITKDPKESRIAEIVRDMQQRIAKIDPEGVVGFLIAIGNKAEDGGVEVACEAGGDWSTQTTLLTAVVSLLSKTAKELTK